MSKTIINVGKKQSNKTMFWISTTIILAVAFIIAGMLNLNNSVKTVFVARQFLSEGTQINADNFDKYIGTMIIPLKTYNNIREQYNLQLLDADLPAKEASKEYILGNAKKGIMPSNSIRYNLEAGDYISKSTVEINLETDPIKIKLNKLAAMSGGVMYDSITIKLKPNDYIQTKGLGKYEDYIRIQIIKENKATRELETIEKFENVPIIDWVMTGPTITALVVALPKDLSSKYFLDRVDAKHIIVTYNPFKSDSMKFVGKKKLTLSQVLESDANGITYDIRDYFKIKKSK